MQSISDSIKSRYSDLFPECYKRRNKLYIYLFILLAVSVILSTLIGPKAIVVIFIPVLIYILSKSMVNFLYLYLIAVPLAFFISTKVADRLCYILVAVFVTTWLFKKLVAREKIEISNALIFLGTFLFFSTLMSNLNGGLTKTELYVLIQILIYFTFLYILYDVIKPQDTIKIFVAIAIPLFVSFTTLTITFINTSSILELLTLYRLKTSGLYSSANAMGYAFLLGTPIWITISLMWKNKKIKLFSIFTSFIFVSAIVMSNARAAIFGIIVSLFFIAKWSKKLKWYFGVPFIIVIVIFTNPTLNKLISIALRIDRGTTGREIIWINTIDMIKKNYLLGVGLGNYSDVYDSYISTANEKNFVGKVPYAHNFMLSKFAELGILGFIWIVFCYYLPIRYCVKLLRKSNCRKDKIITYGLFATILGVYGHSVFEGRIFHLGRLGIDIIFWIIFAIIIKSNKEITKKNESVFFENK